MSSLANFHSKLKVFLDNLNTGLVTPEGVQKLRGLQRSLLLKAVAEKGSNEWFGLQELVGISGVGHTSIEHLVDAPYEPKVVDSVVYYQKNLHSPSAGSKRPISLVSIDIGVVKSAYCLLTSGYEIKDWGIVDMPVCKSYDARANYSMVREFIKQLPQADMYCMECQSHRINSCGGFTAISVNLKVVELALYAVLMSISPNVSTVSPMRVANYFDYRTKELTKKKVAAVTHTKAMILDKLPTPFGNLVTISDVLYKKYSSLKKKDDVSDALLQAVAVMEWREMYEGLNGSKQDAVS